MRNYDSVMGKLRQVGTELRLLGGYFRKRDTQDVYSSDWGTRVIVHVICLLTTTLVYCNGNKINKGD